jgi:hypothetical protein
LIDEDDDLVRGLFLEIDPLPQPAGEARGTISLHHAHRELRFIDEVPAPESVVIVNQTNLCEARVTRARRMHSLFVPDNEAGSPPSDPLTYLVLSFAGCRRGTAGISGVARADIRIRSLRWEALSERATPALFQAVRDLEEGLWGDAPPPPEEFRMLELQAHGVAFVVGRGSWVVRDGIALSGADPITLIEAGPLVLLELETASETWLGTLADFGPVYAPRECEVTDDSGTAMNVRLEPRGNATVVGVLSAGARVTANGVRGSWLRLATNPPGWAHQRGLRCEPAGGAVGP